MFGLRTPELLIIAGVFVLLFGGARLAGLGKGLGEGLRGFKKAVSGEDDAPAGGRGATPKPGGGDTSRA